jgi:hypothetical protein
MRNFIRRFIPELALLVVIIVIILVAVIACFFRPYMESRTYNKLTGAKTTMWDAMWVELRVQDAPKQFEAAPSPTTERYTPVGAPDGSETSKGR